MAAMRRFVDQHLSHRRGEPLRILDIGAMDLNGSYRTFFDDASWTYTGADAEPGPGVDVVLAGPYDWASLPSRSFDVVVSGQAFEHIQFPWVSILEVSRLLRPGGMTCLLVPSGGYEHRYPVDCWRYYPDGIAALASWADLEVIEAVTEWEPRAAYTDDSALWQDTMLVARRPVLQGRHAVQNGAKQALMRAVLLRHARRQERRATAQGPSQMPSTHA